jgi:hypothetical protein
MIRRLCAPLLVAAALASSGCNLSRVKYDNVVKLDPTNRPTVTLEIDPPKKDQEVAIEVSSDQTINVEVVLDKNKGKSKPLAYRTNTKTFNETVTIPANEKFSIVLSLPGPTPAQVAVKANSVN